MKIMEEDGVPSGNTLRGKVLTGTDIIVDTESENFMRPARVATAAEVSSPPPEARIGAIIGGRAELTTIIKDGVSTIGMAKDEVIYLYYAGTAPCAPTLEFTVTNPLELKCRSNVGEGEKPYNIITFESINT